jgi:hypothetical protein
MTLPFNPLRVPADLADASGFFPTLSLLRRVSMLARLGPTSIIGELGGSHSVIDLCSVLEAPLTIAGTPDAKKVDISTHLKTLVNPPSVSYLSSTDWFGLDSLDFLFAGRQLFGDVSEVAAALRSSLKPSGYLLLSSIVQVGTVQNRKALTTVEQVLGTPVRSASASLLALASAGFEPELSETYSLEPVPEPSAEVPLRLVPVQPTQNNKAGRTDGLVIQVVCVRRLDAATAK